MAIIIDESMRVIVQGIASRAGRAGTRLMQDFGTNVVGGCTPGNTGTPGPAVEGVPVFGGVRETLDAIGGADISVIFAPSPAVRDAAVEAIEAGIGTVLLVPDRVPLWDAMEIAAAARANDARFVGPNSLGVISPGRAVIGMIGGRAESARLWFNEPIPGRTIGVASRSGGMTSACGYYLSRAGLGLSTLVHVGGDSVVGTPIPDVALLFEADPETDAIVIFGEIGGSQEERLAAHMRSGRVTKPVIACIGGATAREGTRFSHAGALIESGRGTHAGKVDALSSAGATVVTDFGALPDAAVAALGMATSAGA